MNLSDRELAAVLAGLRLLQTGVQDLYEKGFYANDSILDVLTDCRTLKPLSVEEIDTLCEKINTGGTPPGLAELIEAINVLDEVSDEGGYSDTGDIWNLLYRIRDTLERYTDPAPNLEWLDQGFCPYCGNGHIWGSGESNGPIGGCDKCGRTWGDAETPTPQTVQIEVSGGVASVESKPDGVEVEVWDWDNLEAGGCPRCGAEFEDPAGYEYDSCERCGAEWEV